ncbi:Mismatch repair protein msh3 [Sorochytrium milnesiophthora]
MPRKVLAEPKALKQVSLSAFFTPKAAAGVPEKRKETPDPSSSNGTSPVKRSRFDFTSQSSGADAAPVQETAASTPGDSTLREQFRAKLLSHGNQKSAGDVGGESGGQRMPLTPLEKQVVELKAAHPDILLAFEVGYKYRFFGNDAQTAAKILHIACWLDRNFMTASVPTHRIGVHIRKLVSCGHKVGVVRQTETAALKAAGDNKSGPFARQLTNVYTAATLIDILFVHYSSSPIHILSYGLDCISHEEEDDAAGAELVSNHLVCVRERPNDDFGDSVEISILAVNIATGDILYDNIRDSLLRTELESRLAVLQPAEMVLPTELSPPTEKLLKHSANQSRTVVRVERVSQLQDYNEAVSFLSKHFSGKSAHGRDCLAFIMGLPPGVASCFAMLISHVTQYDLDGVFDATANVQTFGARSEMLLSANALRHLEIFANADDGSVRGSLFSLLNHTQTSFGQRLLRRWVARPLLIEQDLQQRTDAVENLRALHDEMWLAGLQEKLRRCMDLQRALSKMHYGRIQPRELLLLLTQLCEFSTVINLPHIESSGAVSSELLMSILRAIHRTQQLVRPYLRQVVAEAAHKNDKVEMWDLVSNVGVDRYQPLITRKQELETLHDELTAHLAEIRAETRLKLEYTTVAGIEYQVEVPVARSSSVPKDWIRVSATKAVRRFHTPFVHDRLKERAQHLELLNLEGQSVFRQFTQELADNMYIPLREIIYKLAILDCLLSLAQVSRLPHFVRPVRSPQPVIEVAAARHPVLLQLVDGYVPNDISMDAEKHRTLILTGANMAGKSSLIRTVALIVIMAQVGAYVPADSATLGLFDGIHTRMGASDDITRGQSTFFRELNETAEIMRKSTSRSLVVLDEIGRGTSTYDGTAIAHAVLHHFVTVTKCCTLFVTHYPSVCQLQQQFPDHVRNARMAFLETTDEETGASSVVFLYQLVSGVADKSYGLNVARLAQLPEELVRRASELSTEAETAFQRKLNASKLRRLLKPAEHK